MKSLSTKQKITGILVYLVMVIIILSIPATLITMNPNCISAAIAFGLLICFGIVLSGIEPVEPPIRTFKEFKNRLFDKEY